MTIQQKSNKKIEILAAIVLLLFSMGLRVNAPRADLPSHITFSGSILTDEGNQCHNSRSKTLFNEWYPDDWRVTNYNPVLPYFKLAMFKVFGVGMLQLRSVNYIFAFFSLLFFFFLLKSYFKENPKFALLGLLLLGINFLYVMYNKIGTYETSITFWVIMTLYFIEKYRTKQKPLFLFLSGATAAMGFIFKSIMAYLLPLPFAAVILMHLFPLNSAPGTELTGQGFSFKKMGRDLVFVLGGLLVCWVPWYLLHYLPNRDWIINGPGKFMGVMILPDNITQAWQNFLSFPWREQFYKIPVVWIGSLIYIPVFIRRLFQRRATVLEIATILFFFAHTFMFLFMSYRPSRYFVPVIPAIVLMTVLLFERWYATSQSIGTVPPSPVYGVWGKRMIYIIYILDIIWLTGFAYFCAVPVFRRLVGLNPWRPTPTLLYWLVAVVLVSAAYYCKPFLSRVYGRSTNPAKWQARKLTTPLIFLLILLSLAVNLGFYWDWYTKRTYTIYNMGVEWQKKLDHAYIAGMTAAASVLETRHKTLWLYPNFVNWEKDTLEKYPVTHALLGTDMSGEIINFFNQWPERMNQRAALVKIYPIKDYFLHFYSFVDPYIRNFQEAGPQEYRLTVINPSAKPIQTRVGEVYRLPTAPDVRVIRGKQYFQLKPGENQIQVSMTESGLSLPPDAIDVLLFLDYSGPFGPVDQPLRYEGENFRMRTGINKWEPSASNRNVRYFERRISAPGFLSYGPSVPFAPGVFIVNFKLAFSDIKSKLRPLCKLDIYAVEDRKPLAELTLKGSDINRATNGADGYGSYQLSTVVPQTKTLEFRVQTEVLANVAFDYVDVIYYQGIFLPKK